MGLGGRSIHEGTPLDTVMVNINEAKQLAFVFQNQLLHRHDLWYQHFVHFFGFDCFIFVIVILEVESVEVFTDEASSVVATEDTVNSNHRYYFES